MSQLTLRNLVIVLMGSLIGTLGLFGALWLNFQLEAWRQPAPDLVHLVAGASEAPGGGCELRAAGTAAPAARAWVEWIVLDEHGGLVTTGADALARSGGEGSGTWRGAWVAPLTAGQRLLWRAGAGNGAHVVYTVGAVVTECGPGSLSEVTLAIAK